jgi:hypothetical protein
MDQAGRSFGDGDTRRGVARRTTPSMRAANAPRCVGVLLVYNSPNAMPKPWHFLSIQLIYGKNKEPTSGLEPLSSSHYE